jgi:hypothetical protein
MSAGGNRPEKSIVWLAEKVAEVSTAIASETQYQRESRFSRVAKLLSTAPCAKHSPWPSVMAKNVSSAFSTYSSAKPTTPNTNRSGRQHRRDTSVGNSVTADRLTAGRQESTARYFPTITNRLRADDFGETPNLDGSEIEALGKSIADHSVEDSTPPQI